MSMSGFEKVKIMSGTVATVIAELVVGVVMLFVGLFMLDAVYTATALNNSSVFYGISTALISTTGTIFSVLGLVIIVIALGTAINSIMGFARGR
jgi:hypothetical protein